MSDQGSPAPRRALPPLDDVDPDLDDDLDLDDPPPPRRRLWEAAEGAEPGPAPTTPIPPPAAPVLPVPAFAPAVSGRRFSAADLPDSGDSPLPRRSALSPLPPDEDSRTTPETPGSPEESTSDEVATAPAPSPRTEPAAADPTGSVETTGPTVAASESAGGPRRRRGLLAAGVAAFAVTGIVAAVLLNPPTPAIPAAEPSVEPSSLVLAATDLTPLGAEATWLAAPVATRVEAGTPQPTCLPPADELEPRPASSTVAVLESDADDAAVLHQMDAYATAEEAETAFALRREQLAACETGVALLRRTYEVAGLGDEALSVDLVLQGETADQHHLVLSRLGSIVNVVDTSRPDRAFGAADVAAALAAAGARQCAAVGADCPAAEPTVETAPPLPTEPLGWLVGVDLPRITPGQGLWRGTAIDEVMLPSTSCDSVDLGSPAGADTVAQRTYLLTDDGDASANFGVDQGVYTFSSAKTARAFADKVGENIAGCRDRMPTASVKRTGTVDAAGAKGTSFVVSQKLDEGTTRYRVTVLAADEHAVYLFSNPGDDFDFTDGEWAAVAARTAERLAQLP